VVSLLAGLVTLLPACTDLTQVGDQDLWVEQTDGADETNGALELSRAGDAVRATPEELSRARDLVSRRTAWDDRFAQTLLASNAPALDLLDRALAAPDFQVPLDPAPAEDGTSVVTSWISLPTLAGLRAAHAREIGSIDVALARAVDLVRLGRRIETGAHQLLPLMLGSSVFKRLGLEEIERLLPRVEVTPEGARALAKLLDDSQSRPADWARAWAGEYRSMSQVLEHPELIAEQQRPTGWTAAYVYHPNRTRTMFANGYRKLQRDAAKPCNQVDIPEDSSFGMLQRVQLMVRPNPIGHILYEIALPSQHRYQLKRCLAQSHLAAVQALVALRAYGQAHDGLPESLDALVPEFLEQLPVDAFDGQPIRYDQKGGVVYSVGEDFEDHGGDPAQNFRELSAEPTLRIQR
jgi:hypothetical protein